MRLGTPRDPALTLVLILLTCGIYYLYFIYVVSRETQEFLGEPETSPGVEVLLSLLTCGLWNVYWDYRMGKRVAEMCGRVGLPVTDNAVLYLVSEQARWVTGIVLPVDAGTSAAPTAAGYRLTAR